MDGRPSPEAVFAERLLQVIDEGQRTATYKLALLLALIDACGEEAAEDGRAPTVLHTRAIAAHVLRLYFPQARLYLALDGKERQLRQITNKQSAVLNAVLRLRAHADAHRARTIREVADRAPGQYEACLDEVEATFARYPIRLLQNVGRQSVPFLYEPPAWGESVALKALHARGGGLVRFYDRAGDHLLRLAPLLRRLIELHWIRMVADLNGVATEDVRLRAHLFGAQRSSFPALLRSGLADLQDGRCFYCDKPLARASQVDHFLPWGRWPNDAIENLVLADSCNSRKSDYLPARIHVERWGERLVENGPQLTVIADGAAWDRDTPRSLALLRSSYAHLPPGTPLWQLGGTFSLDPPSDIARYLAQLGGAGC